jgi:hypothetical protein
MRHGRTINLLFEYKTIFEMAKIVKSIISYRCFKKARQCTINIKAYENQHHLDPNLRVGFMH